MMKTMNSRETQNSIMKINHCFDHHESDQQLNDFANTHGHNSRMWFNVSPSRHWPKYSYFAFANLQNAKIRVQEPIIRLPEHLLPSEEAAMNHHRIPNAATKLHMPALLTQCSDTNYVHVRVTHAFCCRQNECISLGVNSEDRWLITYANAAELINREKDVSHWDIQAVEVLVDSSSERPSSATPWRCVLRKRLL